MGILKDLNPHKGDIVNIKFKNLNHIMNEAEWDFHETEETYNLGSNTKAYLAGGHFIVNEDFEPADPNDPNDYDSVNLINHLDYNHNFDAWEQTIESIEIVDTGEKFSSREHKILIVRVEDEIFINGIPLIWNEKQKEKEYISKRQQGDPEEYENPNRKLLRMFENYIADMALKESLNPGE